MTNEEMELVAKAKALMAEEDSERQKAEQEEARKKWTEKRKRKENGRRK